MTCIRQFRGFFIILSTSLFVFNPAYGGENDADIQSLISQLTSGNSQSRITAAKELGRLGDKRAVEPLIDCLNNTNIRNPFVKSTAAEALGQIGDPRAVEPLIASLKSREFILHGPAIEALDKIGDKRAVKPLCEFLIGDHRIPPDLEAALKTLGNLGDPNAVDEIVTLLNSNRISEPIRKAAVETMMKLDSRKGIANLVELWKNSDSWSRRRLSKGLIAAGKPAVGPLINILNESNIRPNSNIQSYIESISNTEERKLYTDTIEILAEIGDPAAANVIITNLGARDSSVRDAAKKALIKLHSTAVNPLIRFLRKKESENDWFTSSDIRVTAIEILGKIGDPNAVNILIRCLRADDYSETEAAAKALGKIGDHRAIPHLKKLLQDDDSDTRKTAADALANLNYEAGSDRKNIPFLIAQQNWTQLARIGKPAVAPLIKCMDNWDHEIASGACDAIVEIGEPAVTPLIAYMKRNMPAKPQNTPRRTRRHRLSTNRRPFRSISPLIDTRSGIFRPDFAIEALGEIGDSRAVEPLLEYMKRTGESCPPSVASALGRLGDKRAAEPLIARLNETQLGAASALALTEILGQKAIEHVVPLLPKWGAYNELITAILKLGWKPQTEAEYVYVWAATNNRGELLANWEQTKRILLSDLKNEYKAQRTIAVFLEMKKDDPAVISSLLNLLRTGGSTSESAANAYLNCGHARLIDAAANWFVNKGYKVTYNIWTKDENGNVLSSTSYDKETTPPNVWQKILRENHTWEK